MASGDGAAEEQDHGRRAHSRLRRRQGKNHLFSLPFTRQNIDLSSGDWPIVFFFLKNSLTLPSPPARSPWCRSHVTEYSPSRLLPKNVFPCSEASFEVRTGAASLSTTRKIHFYRRFLYLDPTPRDVMADSILSAAFPLPCCPSVDVSAVVLVGAGDGGPLQSAAAAGGAVASPPEGRADQTPAVAVRQPCDAQAGLAFRRRRLRLRHASTRQTPPRRRTHSRVSRRRRRRRRRADAAAAVVSYIQGHLLLFWRVSSCLMVSNVVSTHRKYQRKGFERRGTTIKIHLVFSFYDVSEGVQTKYLQLSEDSPILRVAADWNRNSNLTITNK